MKKAQIEYLKDRLNKIIRDKEKEKRIELNADKVKFLKDNPPVLLEPDAISDFAPCWSYFYTHPTFNECHNIYNKKVAEYRQALEKQRDTILDEAVLGDKDITALIKTLEEM